VPGTGEFVPSDPDVAGISTGMRFSFILEERYSQQRPRAAAFRGYENSTLVLLPWGEFGDAVRTS
jgi:hypothetical protein